MDSKGMISLKLFALPMNLSIELFDKNFFFHLSKKKINAILQDYFNPNSLLLQFLPKDFCFSKDNSFS